MTWSIHDPVGASISRTPVYVPTAATLRDVARQMWSHNVGALLVGDADHPAGIITERDVIARLSAGDDPDDLTAAEAMTDVVISAGAGDRLFEVASQMVDDGIRHLTVVDDAGAVTGIVSMRDLVRPLIVDAIIGPRAHPEPDVLAERGALPAS